VDSQLRLRDSLTRVYMFSILAYDNMALDIIYMAA